MLRYVTNNVRSPSLRLNVFFFAIMHVHIHSRLFVLIWLINDGVRAYYIFRLLAHLRLQCLNTRAHTLCTRYYFYSCFLPPTAGVAETRRLSVCRARACVSVGIISVIRALRSSAVRQVARVPPLYTRMCTGCLKGVWIASGFLFSYCSHIKTW